MMEQIVQIVSNFITGYEVGKVQFYEPLSRHNTWKVGGPAAVLIEPADPEQVSRVLSLASHTRLPVVVIGQGSNLLFDDAGVNGIVLKIGSSLGKITVKGRKIHAGGGAWVPQVARLAMRSGLSGLEHCIGIPGTIGGLVIMNGGSHRRGIGENIVQVNVVENSGLMKTLTQEDCDFSYRHSALQGSGAVVTEVELLCQPDDPARIRRDMIDDLRARRGKFPRKQPNCGSVFLSTGEMHASVGPPGKIIEESGLKGTRVGQAEVSRQHANFIVNLGGATAMDILRLIYHIRQVVRRNINFDLCCEVRYVDPAGRIIPAHIRSEELYD